MDLILKKSDLTWIQKNGYISQEQVGIIWEQLSQKCTPLPQQGATQQIASLKKNVEIPDPEGLFLGEPQPNDLCIAFSFQNGEKLARFLQKKKKVILASDFNVFDAQELEKRVASSISLVVLLTEECLKQVEVVFALLVAKFYYQHPSLVILVHDAESCFFPGYDEQPESCRDFFSEKAVTYLSCYPEEGVEEILTKFESEAKVLKNIEANYRQKPTEALLNFLTKNNENRKSYPMKEIRNRMKGFMSTEQLDELERLADKNKNDADELRDLLAKLKTEEQQELQLLEEEDEEEHEDLTTRAFLSHKRSTGQGIAGRLYEGLKGSYRIFIDSEAKFKIHDLKLIVQSTDIFVFILTYGILLSKWCLEELKSAVANKKKVIIVRELSYKLPDTLPDEWLEVEPVIRNSRELIWIAEYNTPCVNALLSFIGSPDERYRPALKYFATREGKGTLNAILNRFQSTNILDLNRTIPLPPSVEVDAVLDVVLESIPANQIAIAHISAVQIENGVDSIITGLLSRLPNIEELSVAHSGVAVTDSVVKVICNRYPLLRKLDLEQCVNLTSQSVTYIKELENLTELNLSKISQLGDEDLAILSSGCPKLEVLKLSYGGCTHSAFEHLSSMASLREIEFPFTEKNHQVTQQYIAEHPNVKVHAEPILFDYKTSSGVWYPATISSYTASNTVVHLYGLGQEESADKITFRERRAELGSHKTEYGVQDLDHAVSDCKTCEPLHTAMKDIKFGGSRNKHFINDWYFDTEEGIQFVKEYQEQAAKGEIQFNVSKLPPGIKAASFVKAVCSHKPAEDIRALYLQFSSCDEAAAVVSCFPALKVLFMNGHDWDIAKLVDACPSTLEELYWNGNLSDGSAQKFASRLSNLTTFHAADNYQLSEVGVKALLESNKQLHTLILRHCDCINPNSLAQISQNSKSVTTLNLTLNVNLANEEDKTITELTKGFPSLKKLIIEPSYQESSKYSEFKASRPDVSIEYEKLYLRDIQPNEWYPGILTAEIPGPNPQQTFHIYGVGREALFSNDEIPNKTRAVFSASNYGPQDQFHSTADCFYCTLIHPLCGHLKFDNKPNLFFKKYWYFEQEEGKELLAKFSPTGPENRITFNFELPQEIPQWAIVRALSQTLDLKQTYTLSFPNSVANLAKILGQHLPIQALEFGADCFITDELLKDITEHAPKLKRLILQQCPSITDGWNILNLPELEFLDARGSYGLTESTIQGLGRSIKLRHLNIAGTSLSDSSVEALAKNWSNLTSLDLRKLAITEKSVKVVCQQCPTLESLSLVLCNKIPATACKLIADSLPKLKDLKVPSHWIGSEEYAHLSATRPHIDYVEKSELVDGFDSDTPGWFPAIILEESTAKYLLHFYGYENPKWVEKDSSEIAPLFSHQHEYGSQKHSHFSRGCQYCDILHALCENVEFGGSKNFAFINNWFFDTEEGKAYLNHFADQSSNGKYDFSRELPPGLNIDRVAKAVADTIPAQDIKHLLLPCPISMQVFEALLANKLNLTFLTLAGPFTDTHAGTVSQLCDNLIGLTLLNTDISDEGLSTIASKHSSLESLSIRFCKGISDQGIESFLLTNKNTLHTIELDLQTFSPSCLRVLPKLRNLANVALGYKTGHKQIEAAIAVLKKRKPNTKFTQVPAIFDCQNMYNADSWLPALVTEFNETENGVTVHMFGWPHHFNRFIDLNDASEPFSHKDCYGELLADHMQVSCEECKQLHLLSYSYLFNGMKPSFYKS